MSEGNKPDEEEDDETKPNKKDKMSDSVLDSFIGMGKGFVVLMRGMFNIMQHFFALCWQLVKLGNTFVEEKGKKESKKKSKKGKKK